MSTDKKEARNRYPSHALCYACTLPALINIAREHGYALGIHGSMTTDFDIIAAPWIEEASDAETLIEALRDGVNGTIVRYNKQLPIVAEKPHGRRAWSIIPHKAYGELYLDISVMPIQRESQ